MFGIPLSNILRTLDAIQLHAKDIANGKFLSFEAGVQRSSANHAHRIMEAVRKGDMDLANALFEEAVEESALKKSGDGSISEDALNDAQSALQTAFGKKYKDGEISAEQAEQILVDLFGKSEDDAYWTIKAWDNGGDSRYSAVFDVRASYAALSRRGARRLSARRTRRGSKQNRPHGAGLRPPPAAAGAADRADCRRFCRSACAEGRNGRDRGRAYVHRHARRKQARRAHADLCHPRRVH